MDSYGVFQAGEYLISLPGAVIYLLTLLAAFRVALKVTEDRSPEQFKSGVFVSVLVFLCFLVTWIWIISGLWFYVKA